MLRQLVLIHKPGAASLELPSWLEVKTCLRSFWVGFRPWQLPAIPEGEKDSYQILEGEGAYQLLVEIACGLHSPVLGETEVFGQVRQVCQAYRHPEKKFQQRFQKLIQMLYTDVKLVRRRHLKNLGSKSYGSYARRFFRGATGVRILGTGQLAQEILPWLVKSHDEVIVHSRNPEAVTLERQADNVSLQNYTEVSGFKKGGLLVAAPLKAEMVEKFLKEHSYTADFLLDLREESEPDPISARGRQRHQDLKNVFQSFEANKASTEVIKNAALAEVRACVDARMKASRPSGSEDDSCAG